MSPPCRWLWGSLPPSSVVVSPFSVAVPTSGCSFTDVPPLWTKLSISSSSACVFSSWFVKSAMVWRIPVCSASSTPMRLRNRDRSCSKSPWPLDLASRLPHWRCESSSCSCNRCTVSDFSISSASRDFWSSA
uniref:Putative secreted protein n=1 Tax=Anopheles triannulatus TaxID=58253 RepID=A0A2M4B6R9_9DIPT